jgi:hypothetical protein
MLLSPPVAGDAAPTSPVETGPWPSAVERILALAAARTHRISAALLGDMAGGRCWEHAHDVIDALAGDAAVEAAAAAALRLTRIGHTSGWDVLAGLLGVLAAAPPRTVAGHVE